MLTNATILRIDRQGDTVTADGRRPLVEGDAIAIRCLVDGVTSRRRYELGAIIKDADQTVYLLRSALKGDSPPLNGDRLIVKTDGRDESQTAIVVALGDHVGPGGGVSGGGLTHLELFVRKEI